MLFILMVFAFGIPILLREKFVLTQTIAAIIWFLFLAIVYDPLHDPAYYQELVVLILSFTIPSWVMGSLIAHHLIIKERFPPKNVNENNR